MLTESDRKPKKLVVIGAAGHATVVLDAIKLQKRYEPIGLIDEMNTDRHGTFWKGLEVLGGLERLQTLKSAGIQTAVVAIGDCTARTRLGTILEDNGFELATVVHPSAIVSGDTIIGSGSVVLAGVVINAGARIGKNVIVNTNATVEHDCIIGDGAHIAPACCLAGNVEVGEMCWLGIGSTIVEKITIGDRAFVGAGSVVVENIPPQVLAYGVPARVIRSL